MTMSMSRVVSAHTQTQAGREREADRHWLRTPIMMMIEDAVDYAARHADGCNADGNGD